MEESVQAFDIKRMLIGDLPILFLVEIFVRTTVIYAYALTLIRWLGSRIVGQLSMVEFFIVIALGSAVGDPMFYHDVPMIHSMLVITVIVLFNRALDFFVFKSAKAADIIEGKTVELVRNGIIQHQTAGDLNISNQELFQLLRGKGVENLGDVRAAYFEPDGTVSVFKREASENEAGLQIVPPWDLAPPKTLSAGQKVNVGQISCKQCGYTEMSSADQTLMECPNCSSPNWIISR
ncbi:DUF421 domain-containing protein [Phyllobacterium zundukense]|uniref:YetF C-terminal domain-containing protein n=1 Tax=Phyllobacterium zundukense TaxID=1867719 RepID=A0A2N9W166_9HYPH|nr:YetF domain-containing protein [Phyllobacterium zundukense]ATU94583.1 hypothetical protein BLM14_22630 [Phyllobacterium zundukense]PIO45484.1 hypothetical protein B5P45_07280 [Phyllobacterium zundukense]